LIVAAGLSRGRSFSSDKTMTVVERLALGCTNRQSVRARLAL
jgi:hypothetical protein